jgi:MOSC domain-containing protein YiiM
MLEVPEMDCVAGKGIKGDRYFDYKPDYKGQITFFSREVLERLWEELQVPLEERSVSATRRNVLVSGVDLNSLVGKKFSLGDLVFSGSEECSPCYWMNSVIHTRAEEWMRGRGGLRARILTGGTLRPGRYDSLPY